MDLVLIIYSHSEWIFTVLYIFVSIYFVTNLNSVYLDNHFVFYKQ